MKSISILFFEKLCFIIFVVSCSSNMFGCKKEDKIPPRTSPIVNNIDTLDQKEYLIVKVSNIKEIKGEMKIALYNNKSDFENQTNPVHTAQIQVTKNILEVRFDNIIPSNNYAIAVHHDVNMNGKIDTNFFGIPKEGFCFSNNAMGNFGPPSYEDCRFEVKKGTSVIQDLRLIFF